MATISITISDQVLARVVDAVAATYGYDSTKDGTKAAFAKKQLADYIKGIVRAYEATQAAESARQSAITKVDAEVTIT